MTQEEAQEIVNRLELRGAQIGWEGDTASITLKTFTGDGRVRGVLILRPGRVEVQWNLDPDRPDFKDDHWVQCYF
jgi:hypothetical protein